MVFDALVCNADTIFRLVFQAEDFESAEAKARERLVAGDKLLLVSQA